MADLQCLTCEHGPHTLAPCQRCNCTNWVNAEIQAARALVQINNILCNEIPVVKMMFVDLLELLMEAFPDAVERVDAKREETRQKLQDQAANSPTDPGDGAAPV